MSRHYLSFFVFLGDPYEWSSDDKGNLINILHRSGLTYVGKPNNNANNIIRTTKPVPRSVKSFYFEAKIEECGDKCCIAIGVTQSDPETRTGYLPGHTKNGTLGVGYRGDNGGIYNQTNFFKDEKTQKAEQYTAGDTVGCLLYQNSVHGMEVTQVQFTKNGEKVLSPIQIDNADWHPTIGMSSPGLSIDTNFGEGPFVFDPEGKLISLTTFSKPLRFLAKNIIYYLMNIDKFQTMWRMSKTVVTHSKEQFQRK